MTNQERPETPQYDGIKRGMAFSLGSMGMLAGGYLVGFLHGASAYERSAPMFMGGVALTALFVVALVAIGRSRTQEDSE